MQKLTKGTGSFIASLILVTSILTLSAPAHAADSLPWCAARLATEVFKNAKARGVPKTDQVFGGIAAYIRLICVEQNGLAKGLSKEAADEQIARGMNYGNALIYFPSLPLPDLNP